MNENEKFFEENFELASRIEQEVSEAITEKKKFEFPEEYYKMHYLPQTAKQTEADKKDETEDYLKTAF